ncbi:hypothetical protein [Bacillus paramobilis]|uniref:hypothetical protein n=1 Tax=Bacillus paramobilis TaxID=2817477 RepID=UPI001BB2FFD2|nr:hypothetical protein [Bacillus paramobilis]HEF5065787.1 hypothetical protein [Bacillus cereus]HEF5237771.1 hypothetical protein [Bacillus cereus]
MDKLTEKAIQIIDSMAAKLGVAADHIIQVYSKQVIVEGVQQLFVAAVLVIIGIIAAVLFKKFVKNAEEYFDDYDIGAVFYVVLLIVGMIVGIVSLCTDVPQAIGKLMNPEYYMIKDIVSMFK